MKAGRRSNHLIWVAPLVTFGAVVSYFSVAARFPLLRDFPWLNLPLALLGVGLGAVATWRAWARPGGTRGKVMAPLGLAVSLLLAAALFGYVFWLSYTLPAPTERTLAMAEAPAFTLVASDGSELALADYRGRKVVLVFYRGFW